MAHRSNLTRRHESWKLIVAYRPRPAEALAGPERALFGAAAGTDVDVYPGNVHAIRADVSGENVFDFAIAMGLVLFPFLIPIAAARRRTIAL